MIQNTPVTVSDDDVRAEVIDPTRSFIVQAPAGSGKTSLLVQRYLSLLTTVEEPEEILAITFTNKAAEEMRERVIAMLTQAQQSPEPDPADAYNHKNWILAQRVLERDREKGWELLLAKKRLRLKTIDSFCRYVTMRLPSSSHLGGGLEPSDDSESLYESAISAMIKDIDEAAQTAPNAKHVIAYRAVLKVCGNDKKKLMYNLRCSLQQRSLWLDLSREYLLPLNVNDSKKRAQAELRLNTELTKAMRYHYAPQMTSFQEALDQTEYSQSMLLKVMRYAKDNLVYDGKQQETLRRILEDGLNNYNNEQWPTYRADMPFDNLALIRSAYKLITTSQGEVRKRLTKSEGFPSGPDTHKEWFKNFLEDNRELLQKAIDPLKDLFDSSLRADNGQNDAYKYSPEQIILLQHTSFLLEFAYLYLLDVFRSRHCCDFTEIAINAQEALGTLDKPSELAQQFDSTIKHILVDEYQDTSKAQLDLLEKLTGDWEEGDGRTIFMVGDPMQSIYRFRQAEVGIYLRTRDKGLTKVKPEAKQLTTNFRSSPKLIDWYNTSFKSDDNKKRLFPALDNLTTGAIKYATATSKHQQGGDAPQFHCEKRQGTSDERKEDAAILVVEDIIEPERRNHPQETIAVLVQKRKHANNIIALLRKKNIPYQAFDIEELQATPIVSLLNALTKALLDINDRLSWLTLLRSPWVGLNDKEITLLVEPHDITAYLANTAQSVNADSNAINDSNAIDNSNAINDSNAIDDSNYALRITHYALDPTPHSKLHTPHGELVKSLNVKKTIFEILIQLDWETSALEKESPDATERCRRFFKVMRQALELRGQLALDTWIQGTWIALGGPHALSQPYEYDLAKEYFAFLKDQDQQDFPDAAELDRRLQGRYTIPHAYPSYVNPVKIMTMHGAKGLEFDCVILPFLESKPNNSEDGLLHVGAICPDYTTSIPFFRVQAIDPQDSDKTDEDHNDANNTISDSDNSIHLYKQITEACAANERKRLFYVAATRAKKRLHLVSIEGARSAGQSMIQDLIKAGIFDKPTSHDYKSAEDQPNIDAPTHQDQPLCPIIRVNTSAYAGLTPDEVIPLQERPVYDDTDKTNYGNAVHAILETLLTEDVARDNSVALEMLIEDCCLAIENKRTSDQKRIDRLCVKADLNVMLTSAFGKWALSDYAESSCEQDILVRHDSARYPKLYRLDRTFIDEEGKFWIIDYKTGHEHGKTNPDEYHDIMEKYAQGMANAHNLAEVHLALIYINANRAQKYGGAIFREVGLYRRADDAVEWFPLEK